MGYQPHYLGNGQEIGVAERPCAGRYEEIRSVLQRGGLDPDQRLIIDYGAAEGYFTARLAEDFPELHVIAIDNNRQLRRNVQGYKNVTVIDRRVPPQGLGPLLDQLTGPEGPRRTSGLGIAAWLYLSVLHHLVDWPQALEFAASSGAALLFVELADETEVLPRAISHAQSGDMLAVIEDLEPEVLAATPGYRSAIERLTYVVDFRPEHPDEGRPQVILERLLEKEQLAKLQKTEPAPAPEKGDTHSD